MAKFIITLEDTLNEEGVATCSFGTEIEEGQGEDESVAVTQAFLFLMAIKRLFETGQLGLMAPIICSDFIDPEIMAAHGLGPDGRPLVAVGELPPVPAEEVESAEVVGLDGNSVDD